ncbi:MAG: 1-deoxy-D-xylulose-5-phosphate synthase [Candidatus Omnitrophica bacterium]|nr:1-deoxy-D-xylulose-5-phosphate synthase [Candidatus Omnitrophota bacterium]MBU1929013.1 1-deoxy-D-xylulose-5-phosphate synthase [Candidatus Omnitrophota bacterium]MBU2035671.1 1-deoxy-D-xylulose-5-phosphate synthase [Candidatus Omnitrophota bacterium]MBU2221096.1 1-deoxy-D-xylulose-5-phosphate synthase [Candidatus Omnitrophota bacterium]MBU2258687.1 1-deoxy-D-xylulose-5-phosphate synthase [Candidatus Omnitrophota bacterium]
MLLEKINSPQDLKKLTIEELILLTKEIRERIVDVVSRTGGHLASSLGSVEIITALHYCLSTPVDKIIFDVGHQSYAHKIITGRNKDFDTLRQYNGISGFPSRSESAFDVFTTGHSSTAVSLCLGLACARDNLTPDKYFKVAALIGDGSLSGGLCFEGLNNAGHLKKDMLVILNTNEMSIAPNVGALSTYINKIISLPIYNRFRNNLDNYVRSRLPKESRVLKLANKFEEGLKGLFVPGIFFEELGFRYFGPLDGHDLNRLIPTLKNILNLKGPVLLHVITKKGRGYLPAEKDPVRFHGAVPFEKDTGQPLDNKIAALPTYTEVFSNKLCKLALENKKIVAITAAMCEGTGLDKFRGAYPERFFDVGIAEGHALTFAAGIARAGLKPVVAIYSTFLQRAYDQVIECVALQDLGVVIAIDRAGIVGGDGATHQGIFDIAFLRNVPNLIVLAPKNAQELELMLEWAVSQDKPVVIRYPKAFTPLSHSLSSKIDLGRAEVLKEGRDFLLIALGSMVAPCQEAVESLRGDGIKGALINARFVKPLDINLIKDWAGKTKFVFTAEEGILEGGFGSAVAEAIDKPAIKIGLPSEFIPAGKREILLEKYGLTAKAIIEKIKSVII